MDYSSDDIPKVDFSDEENSYKMKTIKIELPDEADAYSTIETANNIETAESNIQPDLSIINDISVKDEEPNGNSYASLRNHNCHKNAKKSKTIQYCEICYLEVDQISTATHQTYCRDRVFKICSPTKMVLRNKRRKQIPSKIKIQKIELHEALNAVLEGFDVKVASNVFGLDENELKEQLKSMGAKMPQDKTLDNIIETHLQLLRKNCFRASEYSIRRIAYELALMHKKVNVNMYGLADESWYTQFIKHHPALAELKTDFIDRETMILYQRLMVHEFFDRYVQTIFENRFADLSTIYTVETASIILSSQDEVLNPKIDKRASIIVAANSLGDISPAVISSTLKLRQAQTELTLKQQRLGKIDSKIFKKFAIKFANYVKPQKRSFLLLLNENDYYSQSYETYILLKNANIHILGVPNIMVDKLPLGCSLFNKILSRMQLIIHDLHMDEEKVVTNFSDLFNWAKNFTPTMIQTYLKNGFSNCGLAPIDKEKVLQWIHETKAKSSENIFLLVYHVKEMEQDRIEEDQIQTDSTLNFENTNPIVKQERLETSECISEKLDELSEITSGDCSSHVRTPEILDRYINESPKQNVIINKEVKVNLTRLHKKVLKQLKLRQSIITKKIIESSDCNPIVKPEIFETSKKLVQLSEITSGDCSSHVRTPEILDRYINESPKQNVIINKEVKVNLTRLHKKVLKQLKLRQSISTKKIIESSDCNPIVKPEIFETSKKLVQLSEITSGDCSSHVRTPKILDRYINESPRHNIIINKEVKVNLTRLHKKVLKQLKLRQSISTKKNLIESSVCKKYKKRR